MVRFSFVIRRFAIQAVFLLAVIAFLNACVSSQEEVTEGSSASDAATVPGEKVSEESRLASGAGAAPNAGLRW
jgi:hypothetical protein